MNRKTLLVGALIAVTVPVVEALTKFDPQAVTDWRSWAVGLAAASVRQGAVYVLAQIAARKAAQ